MRWLIALFCSAALALSQTASITTLNVTNLNVAGPFDVSFAAPVTLAASGGTRGAASGNLDGDANAEFVAGQNLVIYDWDGSAWDSYQIGNAGAKLDRYGGDVEIADVDDDGDNDIVTTDSSNAGSTGAFLWYENPGSLGGTWTEHSDSTWSGSGTGGSITHAELECGDINADGRVDVVFRDISHGSWVFIRKSDNTGWETRVFLAHNAREGLDLSDLDGDGDLDIVINGAYWQTPADPVAGSYTLIEPTGIDTNWYPDNNNETTINQWAVKALSLDFSGDSQPDILLANAEELGSASGTKPEGITLALAPNDPAAGTWTEVRPRTTRYSYHNLQASDFNFDGSMDFVAAISLVGVDADTPLEMTLFLNNGSGTSFTEQVIQNTVAGYQMVIGDADGDGDQDILLPETFNSGAIRYYENTTL